MNKDDRRVRKTKRALMDALISLLSKKELSSITIRELTDAADIHRATFYVHYADVYDIYKQLEENVIIELREIISKDQVNSYECVYQALINYVYENTSLCKMFIGNSANPNFKRRVNEVLEESYLKIWIYEYKLNEITEEMRFLTAYNVQGCNAIIGRWLEEGFKCSKDDIISLLKKVNNNFEMIN